MRKKEKLDYDNGYLKVHPKGKGNLTSLSLARMEYQDASHLEELKDRIFRHVDGVDWVEIIIPEYKEVCSTCLREI